MKKILFCSVSGQAAVTAAMANIMRDRKSEIIVVDSKFKNNGLEFDKPMFLEIKDNIDDFRNRKNLEKDKIDHSFYHKIGKTNKNKRKDFKN